MNPSAATPEQITLKAATFAVEKPDSAHLEGRLEFTHHSSYARWLAGHPLDLHRGLRRPRYV